MNVSTRLTALAALALAASCAQPGETRNTVQANAISKDDLKGVWYFRQTVVNVPFSTGFTFEGEQGENEMDKIRWDIQEDQLIARRAYEFVAGTEANQPAARDLDGNYLGAPVAAFHIKSHFDIVREYNASTGEEYDKVVENQERKWYERRFIRVDWSTNLVTNFNFLADYSGLSITPIKQDPAPYAVTDPRDPDSMRLERPAEDQPANYLEVTQKLIASPEEVTFEDGSSWPLCFMEYSTTDCASQTIKLRNSFMRAEKRDYEPLVYDDKMMERFGYFTTERRTYNRQYGLVEAGRRRMINRHNIWQHSLTATACVHDTDCGAAEAGKRCVTELPEATIDGNGVVTGVCSLPYAVRNLADPANPNSGDLGPRPVVYYVNDRYPADLKPMARELARQYDETLKGVYKSLTGHDSPHAMFVMCENNPVQPGDPEACGPASTWVRLGDLRYNLMNWVDEPTSAALLGYGPNSNDPETGEVVSSTANIYGAPIDEYSTYARDLVRLVNGEILPTDFIKGENIDGWLKATPFGTHAKTYSQAEVAELAGRMDTSWMKALPHTPAIHKGPVRDHKASAAQRSRALSQSSMLGLNPGHTSARLSKLHGTDVERQLLNGEVLMARGIDPRTPVGAVDLSKFHPDSVFNPERLRMVQAQRRRLSAKGVDMATAIDDSVLGFALGQKGKDPQEVWRKLREQVFLSTALHEVGHTMGLRHNFSGSYDPMNYPRAYWDLRTANGTRQAKPRYVEAPTQAELEGVVKPNGLRAGINEFMQSSLMDYGGNFNSDIDGLGRYDRAALKFGYGQLVEVFNDTKDTFLMGALQASVTYGEAMPLLVDCAGNDFISVHYSKLPQLVNLDSRSDVPFSAVTRKVIRPDCKYPDEVDVDAMNRLVVPYQFCSDEFEGASTGCAAFDRGADPYEVTQAAIDNYKNYYLFDDFRRERLGFDPENHLDRLYGRYLEPIRTAMQFYVLYRSDYAFAIPDDNTATNFWHSPDGWGAYTVAISNGFDFYGDILTMPEPGEYRSYLGDDGREAYYVDDGGDGPAAFVLGLGDARYFATDWEYDSGYFWYERIGHVGSFLDKVAAVAEITDPETYFIGKDVSSDLRQYAINYARLYPRQVTDVWGAALTDRWDRLAPVFDGTRVIKRPISKPVVIPKNGELPIEPQIGFTVQLWMASLGSALLPQTFDTSYADSARVWVAGTGQQLTTTLPTVTYADPFSGKTYTAVSYKDGIIETGVAARMIARANELKGLIDPMDPYTSTVLKNYVQLLESQRSIAQVYENPVE